MRTRHQDGEGVRPGQEVVLGPPPLDDQTDVETEQEGQGDVGQVQTAVKSERLKHLPSPLPPRTERLFLHFLL